MVCRMYAGMCVTDRFFWCSDTKTRHLREGAKSLSVDHQLMRDFRCRRSEVFECGGSFACDLAADFGFFDE